MLKGTLEKIFKNAKNKNKIPQHGTLNTTYCCALTRLLVDRAGALSVAGVDPSEAYVAAVRAGLPGVDVRVAGAEQLPWADDSFDLVAAQLVVHFLADPVAGLREMARVIVPGGAVAACVWDNAGGAGPLSPLWSEARALDADVPDESGAAGAREGQLADLARQAGLVDVESSRLAVQVPFASFEEWWSPLTMGVGSGGVYVQGLAEPERQALRARLEAHFGPSPFSAPAAAWCVRAVAPGADAQHAGRA